MQNIREESTKDKLLASSKNTELKSPSFVTRHKHSKRNRDSDQPSEFILDEGANPQTSLNLFASKEFENNSQCKSRQVVSSTH